MEGDELIGDTHSINDEGGSDYVTAPLSYTEVLDKACPIFMNYGMSYNDYWKGDVEMAVFYAEAHRLRTQAELENHNFKSWLLGIYFDKATQNLGQIILNAFSKRPKKNLKSVFPKEPFDLAESRKPQAPLTKEAEAERMEAIFSLWGGTKQ